MNKHLLKTFLLFLTQIFLATELMGQSTVTVDTTVVLDTGVRSKYGINLNGGVDHDNNRGPGARTLQAAMDEMGVGVIRFPGGKKSQYYQWAKSPQYNDPTTHSWDGYYADQALADSLNFDEFMQLCQQTGAKAHVNVAWNQWGNTADFIDAAAAWVKYAKDEGYQVDYWEIGNEMWKDDLGFTRSTLADLVTDFITAMKAEDPTIKIGVSWKEGEAQAFVNEVNAQGPDLDFFMISNYAMHNGSFNAYRTTNNIDLSKVKSNLSVNTVVSEYNATTWAGDTEDETNSAGKGLINFDLICQFLVDPKCESAALWNTRWYDMAGTKWDALDADNELLPTAMTMKPLQQFLADQMVSASSSDTHVVSYASLDSTTGDLTVFLINKNTASEAVNISVTSPLDFGGDAQIWQFKGTGYMDTSPTYQQEASVPITAKQVQNLSLPPVSVTAIHMTNPPRVEVNPESVSIPEGGTQTFDVRLSELPASTVTVNVSRQSGDSDVSVTSGASLTFTSVNGTDWQTVTLTAAEDADRTNGSATILCADAGSTFTSTTLSAEETDNDNQAPDVAAGTAQTVYLSGEAGGGIPVTGAYFEWDAEPDPSGDNIWRSESGNPYDWSFGGGNRSPSAVSDPRFDMVLFAYDFPASEATGSAFNSFGSADPATFEFVVDVDDASAGSIFETGGSTKGFQLDVVNGDLRARIANNGIVEVTYTLAPEDLGRFIHVVVVIDNQNQVELYVDNQRRDFVAWVEDNWSGSNGSGLGSRNSDSPNGGSIADLTGKIALMRYYANTVFTAANVNTNFQSLSNGSVATASLDGTVSDPDGDSFTTLWSMTSGPSSVSFDDASVIDTVATFTAAGTYVLRLTADDGVGSSNHEVTVTVVEPSALYTTWTEGTFTHSFTNTDPLDNTDGDVAFNLLEFAFGLDPTVSDYVMTQYVEGGDILVAGSPTIFLQPGDVDLAIYIRHKQHQAAGLVYTIDFSADLHVWTPSMDTPTVRTSEAASGDYEAVGVAFPDAVPVQGGGPDEPPMFFRVGVESL